MFLTTSCAGCAQPGSSPCAACAAALQPAPCPPPPPGLSQVTALFVYEGVGRDLVSALKFRHARATVDWFVHGLICRLGASAAEVDVVTWLPASRRQRRKRGFDQAELLGHRIAAELHCTASATLRRVDHGRQTGRSRAQRLAGPVLCPVGSSAEAQVRCRRVLLVDDVMTTGASLAAGANTLRAIGAADVTAAVVAYSR